MLIKKIRNDGEFSDEIQVLQQNDWKEEEFKVIN